MPENEEKPEYLLELEEDGKDAVRSAVSTQIQGLYSDDFDERREASSRLVQIARYYPELTAPACEKLRHLVRTDRHWVLSNSLKILRLVGKHEPEEIRSVIGTAISLLYHENAKIREEGTKLLTTALNRYPKKVRPAIPRLVELLDDENELPRAPAARAIAGLAHHFPSDVKSEETVSRLERMSDPDSGTERRGPELTEEQVTYANEALANIQAAIDQRDVQLPESILDRELRLRVVEHFENEQYQSAVQQAFITLEERIRDKGGFSYEDSGTAMIVDAFHHENGPLSFGETPAEKEGVMLLYKSSFQTFRNPSSHRFVEKIDGTYAHNTICFVNLLLRLLGPTSTKT